MKHTVFVSYLVADEQVALSVCRSLEQHGIPCWIAPRNVPRDCPSWSGEGAVVSEAIRGSRLFLLLLSARAVTSRTFERVAREVAEARAQERKMLVLRIEEAAPRASDEGFLGFEKATWLDIHNLDLQEREASVIEAVQRLTAKVCSQGRPEARSRKFAQASGGPAYHVFLSYRREGGAETARLVKYALESQGRRVFLDVTDLGTGHFDNTLLDTIAATPNFVVILSPDSLMRCAEQGDWLRREITHALATQRNVLPVFMPGFRFPGPDDLPPDMVDLPRHNGVPFSHEFFDAMVARIVERLR